MKTLLNKELNSNTKFLKPDLTKKNGRELFVVYLQAKFRQLIEHDRKRDENDEFKRP